MLDVSGCYDCGSVMHYGANGFSNGQGPTIEAIDPDNCVFQRNSVQPLTVNDGHVSIIFICYNITIYFLM